MKVKSFINFYQQTNPLCSCSPETERMAHFFIRCRNYTNIRITLMNDLNDIDNSITSRQPNKLLRIILYSDCKFKDNVNKQILITTIKIIKNSNRFNQSLIQSVKQHKRVYQAISNLMVCCFIL